MKYGCISGMSHRTIFERKQNKGPWTVYHDFSRPWSTFWSIKEIHLATPRFFTPLPSLCSADNKARRHINHTNIFSSLHEMVVSYNAINYSTDLFLFWFPLGSLPGCFWEKASGQSRQARQRYCNGDDEERTCAAYKTKTSQTVGRSASFGRIQVRQWSFTFRTKFPSPLVPVNM